MAATRTGYIVNLSQPDMVCKAKFDTPGSPVSTQM
jgi:hypothetical protein